jgi:hypothetical protein
MRNAVTELIELGPLPSSDNPDIEKLKKYQELLESIQPPLSDEEAKSLIGLFGPDECFGLAWSLLHLIESAPGWPLLESLEGSENEWVVRLRERAARAG